MLENRIAAGMRGWSNRGSSVAYNRSIGKPLRQTCHWNDKESFDLLEAYTKGESIKSLAAKHQRGINAIECQLFIENRGLRKAMNYLEKK